MKYKLKILTNNKTYEYKLETMSVYNWDSIVGFNQYDVNDKLNNVEILRNITTQMISKNFIDEFYMILNQNRRYSSEYKEYLGPILYALQFDFFELDPDFKKPNLIYIEGFIDNQGDYIKYPYIDDDKWNFESITAEIDKKRTI
ncbi:DUF1473 family protein [Borrelia crocidurae]|uniref:Uncharacterized protein n=1 Tax=Borrelia crocidurae (strain Achema) TaxID=1155096 RepID=I0FEF9_BORCA|nr:DUF1473 family protein [Borrelia crocidurae]AFI31865.1 Protein of unknown function (DUF1473)-containing protein [Borrelia crocidurae str. Achema]